MLDEFRLFCKICTILFGYSEGSQNINKQSRIFRVHSAHLLKFHIIRISYSYPYIYL